MTIQTTTRRSRRALLAGAAAGAAALAADRLARPLPALATDGDNVLLGANHISTSVTNITGGGLRLEGGALGFALLAHGVKNGDGILGSSVADATVTPESAMGSGVGVAGDTGSGSGVRGTATTGTGVEGHSESGPGVAGRSGTGPGVEGRSETADGVRGWSQAAGTHGVKGESVDGDGVFGLSQNWNAVSGASASGSVAAVIGQSLASLGSFEERGSGIGVHGASGSGIGVQGISESGAGVEGRSDSGPGVVGHSSSGEGGHFSTDTGYALSADGPSRFEGNVNGFLLGLDNASTGEIGGGILANSRGGKPTIEADVFPSESNPGVGIQGVSYTGTSYEDGEFAEGPGIGVQGLSGTGTGVEGRSGSGPGVTAQSQSGNAFEGGSETGAGAFVGSSTGPGVDATGGIVGVSGWSPSGIAGVVGIGSIVRGEGTVPEEARGVLGIAPGDAPAVQCVSGGLLDQDTHPWTPNPDGGLALDVVGKVRFSTAGAATVPQGQNSVFVPNASVTPNSHISITLISDPGPRQLRWLSRSGGSGFTVYFAGGPPGQRPATDFTYLIVEPPA